MDQVHHLFLCFPFELLGRQLATASVGAPVFEVYLRDSKGGDYKQQVCSLMLQGSLVVYVCSITIMM